LKLQLPDTSNSFTPVSNPPIPRRRDWTAEENRDFEKWITSNPKPTKQQKEEFANSHHLLTTSQVQSKINNWRNGRNIQRKQIILQKDDVAGALEDTIQVIDQSMNAAVLAKGKWRSTGYVYLANIPRRAQGLQGLRMRRVNETN
jgi:hypothetical protein